MVRATFSGFSTALSALQANQKRLDITGQNLANMNTVGYTRQQLETSSFNYTNPVSHYMNGSQITVGYGTKMDKVSQIRDPYLDVQYREQIADSSYNDALQTALDNLSNIFDESNIKGIRQAFDDIQSTLSNMQDPSKINNLIYESELQVRMKSLTNLLNEAARQLEAEELAEFQHLDGTGTSEQGAIQKINEILKQVGDLNIQIKRNQIHGQPSLELLDERNILLDELASYIPIEVSYYNEEKFEGWPDDLKVDMVYTKEDGTTDRLTLIDGTKGGSGKNYGEVTLDGDYDTIVNDPASVSLAFRAAQGEATTEPTPVTSFNTSTADNNNDGIKDTITGKRFASGSVQASLDMLGQSGTGGTGDTVRGYQYYMNQLNTLAKTFADTMNNINKTSYGITDASDTSKDLLEGDSAKTIGLRDEWISGTVQISRSGESTNETVLEMLAAMSDTYSALNDNSFTDYMNHVSTILANDSRINQSTLETNVTILNGIQESRDSISAVSLDEEATNMMTYLSAYNAASRLMTTLDEALNTLINGTGLVGR